MKKADKEFMWKLPLIIGVSLLALSPLIMQGWNYLTIQAGAKQVSRNVINAAQNFSPHETDDFIEVVGKAKALYLSKLSQSEQEKAVYLMQCSAEGTCSNEELIEQVNLLKRAKAQYTPEELLLDNKAQEMVYKMAKLQQ